MLKAKRLIMCYKKAPSILITLIDFLSVYPGNYDLLNKSVRLISLIGTNFD